MLMSIGLMLVAAVAASAVAGGALGLKQIADYLDDPQTRPVAIAKSIVLITLYAALSVVCALAAFGASVVVITFGLILAVIGGFILHRVIVITETKSLIFKVSE